MRVDRFSSVLLLSGSAFLLLVMLTHPTGHDLRSDAFARQAHINVLVHALALGTIPLLFTGLIGLWRRLQPSGLATLALVTWGFGSVAVLGAAVASGFVATDVYHDLSSDTAQPVHEQLASYTYSWNQGFSKVWAAATAVAVALWSLAIFRTGRTHRSVGALGLSFALGALLALWSGRLELDVRGFGLFVIAQSAWLLLVAVALLRPSADGSDTPA